MESVGEAPCGSDLKVIVLFYRVEFNNIITIK